MVKVSKGSGLGDTSRSGFLLCTAAHHLFNPVACKCSGGLLPGWTIFAPVARGSTAPRGVHYRGSCCLPSPPNRIGGTVRGGLHALLVPGLCLQSSVVLELCFWPAVRPAHKYGSRETQNRGGHVPLRHHPYIYGGQHVSGRTWTSFVFTGTAGHWGHGCTCFPAFWDKKMD